MEIADEDVRIKETESKKPDELKKSKTIPKVRKGKLISRSQSVSNAQTDNIMGNITEIDRETSHYSSTSSMKVGSFSIPLDKDLSNWKDPESQAEVSPSASLPTPAITIKQEEPIVVVANSMEDKSRFTIGFEVDDNSKD